MFGYITVWGLALDIPPLSQLVCSLSSAIDVAVDLQKLMPASLVADHLRPSQFWIYLPKVQLCHLTSCILKADEFRNNLVHELLEPHLDCRSDLASSSDVGKGLSTLAAPQYGIQSLNSYEHKIVVKGPVFLCAETATGTICILTSCDPWIPATDKDAFRPWNWSLDTTDFSTNEIEDLESHVASIFRLKSLFASLSVAVSSEKSLLCRLPQLGTLHVLLLQSFDMWPGLKQLKHSEILDTLSSFIYFHWFELFTPPNRVLSNFEGTFEFLWFAWLFSDWSKGTRLRFITALVFISFKRQVFVILKYRFYHINLC